MSEETHEHHAPLSKHRLTGHLFIVDVDKKEAAHKE